MAVEINLLQHHGGVIPNDLKHILGKYVDEENDMENVTLLSSPYYSIDGMIAQLNRLLEKFIVLSFNCQSLSAKYD